MSSEIQSYQEQAPVVVSSSLPEHLTKQFYDWEKRGRGWKVWGFPVVLEPPFQPFFHYLPQGQVHDDGRIPGIFEELWDDLLTALNLRASPRKQVIESFVIGETVIDSYGHNESVEIQISLPPTYKTSKETAEQFLLSLSYSSYPLGFEVIGTSDSIVCQICCQKEDRDSVVQQIRAYFPEAVLTEKTDYLKTKWNGLPEKNALVVDFGLSREFMLPLRRFEKFEVDPLIGTIGALSHLLEGEIGVFQILFQKTVYPWSESIMRSVLDYEGKPFFVDFPHLASLAKEKTSSPLFSVVVRVAAQTDSKERTWQIVKNLGGSLTQFSDSSGNELMPLENDGYSSESDLELVVKNRWSERSGMILNADELVSLAHFPSASVRSEKLRPKTQKTKPAPAITHSGDLILGENLQEGKKSEVRLNSDQRMKHAYVIGASGTGKSTLLLNMIVQDIKNGKGIAVLDPHGDLIDAVLTHIPEERFSDVILFDPSDEQYPVGFNILSAHSELEKNLLSSDLVSVFRRLSTSWGDQMTSVLGNAILAFLESDHGGTLADMRRFLIEKEYRNSFLPSVKDQEVVYFWQKEFPLLSGKPQGPLLTRLDTFLRPKLIRYMVSQKENRINFSTVMNEGKIFLAKLSQGAIGEENAYLLGSLLVSRFHQTAMSRQEIKESERKDFFLYMDEFHNFVTPSMASILAGTRKYHLGLILAHQELRQLLNRDTDIASAVLSNPYTRICFRLGDFDAQKLADGFSFFDSKDLQNLGIGEAICRVERSDYDFNLMTSPLPKVNDDLAQKNLTRIQELSRKKYGTRREVVEEALSRLFVPPPIQETVPIQEPKDVKPEIVPEPAGVSPAEKTRPVQKGAKPKIRPESLAPMGRGGPQHKYLQQLIKRMAEDKGYRATIEKPIDDGKGLSGSVDVALKQEGRSIACEISVTSTPDYELGNLEKCLAAGFEQVVLISSEMRTLNKVKALAAETLSEKDMVRVRFLTPDEFYTFLAGAEAQSASGQETIVRGYKVKTNFRPVGKEEEHSRMKSITQVIMQGLRKLKGE